MNRNLVSIAVAGAVLLATGCSTTSVPLAADMYQEVPPPITLGPGDRLRVIVYGNETLSSEYGVAPDGTITMPLLGNVSVVGLTTADLADSIVDQLSPDYMLNPEVTLEVINYRPFYIYGEVSRPGQYPFAGSLSVSQAIAAAGGYTYRANTRWAYIRRERTGEEEAYEILPDRPIWVTPGDTVRIGERYF